MQNKGLVSFDAFGMAEVHDADLLAAVAGGDPPPTVALNGFCPGNNGDDHDIFVNVQCRPGLGPVGLPTAGAHP